MDLLNAVDELNTPDDAKRLILKLNARHQSELEALLAASQQLNRKLLELVAQLEQRAAELEKNTGSTLLP